MYQNGMGLRSIERATGIHNTTLMHWVREAEANAAELYGSDDGERDGSS